MALYLEDFVNEQTLKPFVEQRIEHYENKAISFLRDQFAPAVGLLSDEEVRKVVQLAYQNAKKRGIQSERDHLKYLIPVMFWGSYFETDPQYQPQLIRSGWLSENGEPITNPYVAPILAEIDTWYEETKIELENPRNIIFEFARIYRGESREISVQSVFSHMRAIWPVRSQKMNDVQIETFIQAAYAHSQRLNFVGEDGIMFVCLAQYFGHCCDQDPLYPWIGKALLNDGRSQNERRLALESEILKYWKELLGA